ncbi:uncharacterized protein LOC119799196, partial [Cyprinodon tularosa]|uniref:uncharacterized protein LOC119799196 n=1 Tax=Cyprinodon tularosa TaxID=77115 RepID=UPI0018E2601E
CLYIQIQRTPINNRTSIHIKIQRTPINNRTSIHIKFSDPKFSIIICLYIQIQRTPINNRTSIHIKFSDPKFSIIRTVYFNPVSLVCLYIQIQRTPINNRTSIHIKFSDPKFSIISRTSILRKDKYFTHSLTHSITKGTVYFNPVSLVCLYIQIQRTPINNRTSIHIKFSDPKFSIISRTSIHRKDKYFTHSLTHSITEGTVYFNPVSLVCLYIQIQRTPINNRTSIHIKFSDPKFSIISRTSIHRKDKYFTHSLTHSITEGTVYFNPVSLVCLYIQIQRTPINNRTSIHIKFSDPKFSIISRTSILRKDKYLPHSQLFQ